MSKVGDTWLAWRTPRAEDTVAGTELLDNRQKAFLGSPNSYTIAVPMLPIESARECKTNCSEGQPSAESSSCGYCVGRNNDKTAFERGGYLLVVFTAF